MPLWADARNVHFTGFGARSARGFSIPTNETGFFDAAPGLFDDADWISLTTAEGFHQALLSFHLSPTSEGSWPTGSTPALPAWSSARSTRSGSGTEGRRRTRSRAASQGSRMNKSLLATTLLSPLWSLGEIGSSQLTTSTLSRSTRPGRAWQPSAAPLPRELRSLRSWARTSWLSTLTMAPTGSSGAQRTTQRSGSRPVIRPRATYQSEILRTL